MSQLGYNKSCYNDYKTYVMRLTHKVAVADNSSANSHDDYKVYAMRLTQDKRAPISTPEPFSSKPPSSLTSNNFMKPHASRNVPPHFWEKCATL
jgi:hypothetical protein